MTDERKRGRVTTVGWPQRPKGETEPGNNNETISVFADALLGVTESRPEKRKTEYGKTKPGERESQA